MEDKGYKSVAIFFGGGANLQNQLKRVDLLQICLSCFLWQIHRTYCMYSLTANLIVSQLPSFSILPACDFQYYSHQSCIPKKKKENPNKNPSIYITDRFEQVSNVAAYYEWSDNPLWTSETQTVGFASSFRSLTYFFAPSVQELGSWQLVLFSAG